MDGTAWSSIYRMPCHRPVVVQLGAWVAPNTVELDKTLRRQDLYRWVMIVAIRCPPPTKKIQNMQRSWESTGHGPAKQTACAGQTVCRQRWVHERQETDTWNLCVCQDTRDMQCMCACACRWVHVDACICMRERKGERERVLDPSCHLLVVCVSYNMCGHAVAGPCGDLISFVHVLNCIDIDYIDSGITCHLQRLILLNTRDAHTGQLLSLSFVPAGSKHPVTIRFWWILYWIMKFKFAVSLCCKFTQCCKFAQHDNFPGRKLLLYR